MLATGLSRRFPDVQDTLPSQRILVREQLLTDIGRASETRKTRCAKNRNSPADLT